MDVVPRPDDGNDNILDEIDSFLNGDDHAKTKELDDDTVDDKVTKGITSAGFHQLWNWIMIPLMTEATDLQEMNNCITLTWFVK